MAAIATARQARSPLYIERSVGTVPETGDGVLPSAIAPGIVPETALAALPASAAGVLNWAQKRAKNSAAIFLAMPSISREPTCASLPHTSELQSLMRISYAVFCLKKKTKNYILIQQNHKEIKDHQ